MDRNAAKIMFVEKTWSPCNLDSNRVLYYGLKSGFPVNISCWVARTEKIYFMGNTLHLLFFRKFSW